MKATRTKRAASRPQKATNRTRQLRTMLERRREELSQQVRGRIRDVRGERTNDREAAGQDETADAEGQQDLDLTLIEMTSETLRKVDAALRRLEQGTYGNCFECGDPISEARLTALPFAVRCMRCEEQRESAAARRVSSTHRRAPSALFTGVPE